MERRAEVLRPHEKVNTIEAKLGTCQGCAKHIVNRVTISG